MNAPLMQIGGIDKGSLDSAAEAIILVATCSPFEDVCMKALDVMRHLAETSNVSVSNCTFVGNSDPETEMAGIGIEPLFTIPVHGSDAKMTGDI